MKRLTAALAAGCVVMLALALVVSAGAQSGGDPIEALSTAVALDGLATRQAIDAMGNTTNAQAAASAARAAAAAAEARAAQQLALATQQAGQIQLARAVQQATVAAAFQLATLQAAATQSAQQGQATATAQAQSAQATAQAIQAAQSVRATRDALDAQATIAAYDVAIGTSRRQAEVGVTLLWTAAALAIVGAGYVIIAWARSVANRSPKPAPQADTVITGWACASRVAPVPLLPAPRDAVQVQVINDTAMNDVIRRWWDAQPDSMESGDE